MAEEKGSTYSKIESITNTGHQFLQDGHFENSYLAYEKALELARETNEGFTIRACFFNLGACCVAKGEASKGLQFLLKAVPSENEDDGHSNFADLQYNLAVAYDVLGERNEAKTCYETALKGYKDLSNLEMEGEVFLKLGGALSSLNLLKEAAEAFHDGEKIFHECNDDRHEVLCVSSRATLLAEMRDEHCQGLVEIVVERVTRLQDDLLKAKVYSDIGLVYTSTGNCDCAADYLEKSLNLIQSCEGHDEKLEASLCQNLGAVHNQLGSYKKAIIFHEKAIELYGLLGMRYAQGHCFSNLGFACGQLGKLGKSQESFMHALQAAKDCQDYRGQWQGNEGLSAVFFQQNEYEKAISCLKAALSSLALDGIDDKVIHDRIVSKLSNALENKLIKKNQLITKHKSVIVQEPSGKFNVDGYPPKNGNIRPREKNHKLIARGLELENDEQHSTVKEDSDSTFDSISSITGSCVGSVEKSEEKQENNELVHEEKSQLKPKKDPLNNTYEEPQDIIQVIQGDPHQSNNMVSSLSVENKTVNQSSNAPTKSRTCIIQ